MQTSKRPKRGYTDPEVYAHLHPLQDYLKEGLDVVFYGINPGRMSAETGHHFANPTNHFWHCLHRSGLTSTLLPPSEDYSLPDRYNLGLTNIVDRPSTEAAELSKSEIKASIPAFLRKISRHKPRFVCFVGMGIWEVVQSTLSRMALSSDTADGNKKANRKQKESGLSLQPYKLVHPSQELSDHTDGIVSETLIFVVPSTSGRVVRYQLTDKIAFFAELRALLHKPDVNTEDMFLIRTETQD
ncbi:uracil-DNA glycosylase-like protein [Scleroderma citrinum]